MNLSRQPQAPEVDVTQMAVLMAEGAVLIDVRMPDEYAVVHVPGAVLIPLPELGERTAEVPKDQEVYVICGVGGRSLTAAEALNNAGWNAVSVAGGTRGWVSAGFPVSTGSDI